MQKTLIVGVAAAAGLIVGARVSAAPQAITSAVFSASAEYCGIARSIPVAAGDIPFADCLEVAGACGATTYDISACLAASGLTIDVSATDSRSFGIPFVVTAGPEGAVVRCSAAGIEARDENGEPIGEGDRVIPARGSIFVVIGWPHAASTEGAVSVTVLGGSVAAARVDEFGEILSGADDSFAWTCTAERAWIFTMGDLACPPVPCHDGGRECGGQSGAAQADADEIFASVDGGLPVAGSLSITCDFVLSAPVLMRYDIEGGPYCDPSFVDGEELAFDPDEGCTSDFGFICLEAGAHTMRVYNYDLGQSSLRLQVLQEGCNDCDGNGLEDRNEIEWDSSFGDGDLDTNGNLRLDSCERAAGDLDLDGVVGSTDLGILLAAWGGSGADLNGDGRTDAIDLGILLATWD